MTNLVLQTFNLTCSSTQSLAHPQENWRGIQVPQLLYFHDNWTIIVIWWDFVYCFQIPISYDGFLSLLIINLLSPVSWHKALTMAFVKMEFSSVELRLLYISLRQVNYVWPKGLVKKSEKCYFLVLINRPESIVTGLRQCCWQYVRQCLDMERYFQWEWPNKKQWPNMPHRYSTCSFFVFIFLFCHGLDRVTVLSMCHCLILIINQTLAIITM